jgi:protein-disulfide isomerase
MTLEPQPSAVPETSMKNRLTVTMAIAGAVLVAAIGFAVGILYSERGLSEKQRSDAATVVGAYITAHPDLLAPPMTPAAPATPVMSGKMGGAAGTHTAELSDDQRAEVEAIIKNYLIANPEIVRDALTELQRKEDAATQMAQGKIIADSSSLLFSSTRQVVLGNPKGDVTLVEFFDYNCTYCRRAHADMKKLIDEDKNLRIVLKEFPVLGPSSVEAAQVGAAVNLIAPERYGEFHDALISDRGQVNGERALAVAGDLGLDTAKIKEEMASDEVKATISEVYDLANKLSLTGTPSYVTAKEVVVGAVGYDSLKEKIAALRCTQPNC